MTLRDTLPGQVAVNRRLIGKLAKNDFKTRYAGSYLGTVWAFIQPIVTVTIYWLIFGHGLKSGQSLDVPFIVYLVCGIVPWFYCQEVMSGGTNTLLEYSYLVKKVVFNIRVLPFVKVLSAPSPDILPSTYMAVSPSPSSGRSYSGSSIILPMRPMMAPMPSPLICFLMFSAKTFLAFRYTSS